MDMYIMTVGIIFINIKAFNERQAQMSRSKTIPKAGVIGLICVLLILCACSEKPTVLEEPFPGEPLDQVISFSIPEGYEDIGVWTESQDGKRLEEILRNADGTEIGIGIVSYKRNQVLNTINGIDVLDYLSEDGSSLKDSLTEEDYLLGYPDIFKTSISAKGDTYYYSRCTPRTEDYYESENTDKNGDSPKLLEAVTENGSYVIYFNIWNADRELTADEDRMFEDMLYGVVFKTN